MPVTGTTLTIARQFRQSPQRVFAAWADAIAMSKWIGGAGFTAPPLTSDFRVGGHYDVGIRSPEGQTYRWGGQYLEIAEPTRLSFTVAYYGWPGDITLTDAPENVITITFAPSGSGTLMTFEQAPLAPNINPTNHEDGWRAAFDKLEQSLSAMVAS